MREGVFLRQNCTGEQKNLVLYHSEKLWYNDFKVYEGVEPVKYL
jgi:hypothetical protein